MMHIALWIAQVLLAAVFLAYGVLKLTTPLDNLAQQIGVPGTLIQFVSVMEILGAAGLVLPGLLRIGQQLIPLAAAGLTIIMAGAVALGVRAGDPFSIAVPLVIGMLTAYVADARWRTEPLHEAVETVRTSTAPNEGEATAGPAHLRPADQNV